MGNINSGDQNFLNPFIHHRDTSHYMVLKKIDVTPSAPFAPILTTRIIFLKKRGKNGLVSILQFGTVVSYF